MAKAKVLRTDFTTATDDQLDSKANAVKNGLTDGAAEFPAPPITPAALAILITTYINTYNAYKRGGLDQKPAFINAKTALLEALEDDADYVDSIADGSEELIVKAGYVPTKTTASPVPAPAKPAAVVAKRGEAIGEILVECPVVEGDEFYGLVISEGAPLNNFQFQNGLFSLSVIPNSMGIDVNKSRKKRLQGLQPGTTYYFYMYCGNSNGISALSDVVQLMAA